MIGCVDVHYENDRAAAALVIFEDWSSASPDSEHTEFTDCPGPYVSGEFYKRELPALLSVIRKCDCQLSVLLIDGYVWLGSDTEGRRRPGLGAHLYEALDRRSAVIGAAKTVFKAADGTPVLRGKSRSPLYVSSVGIDVSEASELVRKMHGDDRIPTMVKLADRLARQAAGL